MSKLEKLLEDIDKYRDLKFEDQVKERLNKSLYKYMKDLDDTISRIEENDYKMIIKEFNK